MEHLPHGRLLQHFTNEREGGFDVTLDYVLWYLIGSAFIRRLQLVACFSKVRGVLVDVFGAIVYLQAPLPRKDAFLTRQS
jgi:hypothetical protein